MGNQLIIIGCTGSFNEGLVADIVALLGEKGMQTLHASNCYEGSTHFAVGTPGDLSEALGKLGVQIQVAEGVLAGALPGWDGAVDAPGGVTLEGVHDKLELLLKGQNDLADLINDATNGGPEAVTPEVVNENVLKVLALVQTGTQPAVLEAPSKKKKKGAGGEEKPVTLGTGAHVEEKVNEGVLAGSPVAGAPEGGWPAVEEPKVEEVQPLEETQLDVVEETTGTKTLKQEEGAEG